MPTAQLINKTFNSYRIEYGITNPQGKDLVRIEFLSGDSKIGQALFGDAIAPGSFASLGQREEIDLFFPLTHFANILNLLRTQTELSLFGEPDDTQPGQLRRGGVLSHTRPIHKFSLAMIQDDSA